MTLPAPAQWTWKRDKLKRNVYDIFIDGFGKPAQGTLLCSVWFAPDWKPEAHKATLDAICAAMNERNPQP